MKFEFDSVEEVLAFASRISNPAPTPGEVRPGNIDPAAFADTLGRVARGTGKVQAIKLYRAVFNVSLGDAKAAIDRVPEFAPEHVHDERFTVQHSCGDPDCGCGYGNEPY